MPNRVDEFGDPVEKPGLRASEAEFLGAESGVVLAREAGSDEDRCILVLLEDEAN